MVHGECPEVVNPLHIIRSTLYNVAKLVSAAVDLLAGELDHNDGILFQELEVNKFNFASVKNSWVSSQPLCKARETSDKIQQALCTCL